MSAVAEEADKVPAWKHYARYCSLREQGLRKQDLVATHHLPHYFIGDEREVKSIADEARDHIFILEQPDRRNLLQTQLRQEEQLLDDWIAFNQDLARISTHGAEAKDVSILG